MRKPTRRAVLTGIGAAVAAGGGLAKVAEAATSPPPIRLGSIEKISEMVDALRYAYFTIPAYNELAWKLHEFFSRGGGLGPLTATFAIEDGITVWKPTAEVEALFAEVGAFQASMLKCS